MTKLRNVLDDFCFFFISSISQVTRCRPIIFGYCINFSCLCLRSASEHQVYFLFVVFFFVFFFFFYDDVPLLVRPSIV